MARSTGSRLTNLLRLREGMTVAEIGAGTGWLAVEVARAGGPSGRVYATEPSPRRLNDIRAAVAQAELSNVMVVTAGEQSANLPPACCFAIFMRRVYHHLSDSTAITRDLHDALVPGGRLVIIEFESGGVLGLVTQMGIAQTSLIDQVTACRIRVRGCRPVARLGSLRGCFSKVAFVGKNRHATHPRLSGAVGSITSRAFETSRATRIAQ